MDPVQKSYWVGLLFTQGYSGTGSEWIQMDPKLDRLICRPIGDRYLFFVIKKINVNYLFLIGLFGLHLR